MAPVRGDGHFGPMPPVARERPVDGTFVFPRAAVDECDVRFFDQAIAELFGEGFVSLLVLGDEDKAGGVFVEAVYDADPVSTTCGSGWLKLTARHRFGKAAPT